MSYISPYTGAQFDFSVENSRHVLQSAIDPTTVLNPDYNPPTNNQFYKIFAPSDGDVFITPQFNFLEDSVYILSGYLEADFFEDDLNTESATPRVAGFLYYYANDINHSTISISATNPNKDITVPNYVRGNGFRDAVSLQNTSEVESTDLDVAISLPTAFLENTNQGYVIRGVINAKQGGNIRFGWTAVSKNASVIIYNSFFKLSQVQSGELVDLGAPTIDPVVESE